MHPALAKSDLKVQVEIAAIRNAWTAGFDVWQILSEREAEPYGHGLVTDFVVPALEKPGSGAQAHMCGPPPLLDAGVDALTAHGISLEDIRYDKFTDASTQAAASTED